MTEGVARTGRSPAGGGVEVRDHSPRALQRHVGRHASACHHRHRDARLRGRRRRRQRHLRQIVGNLAQQGGNLIPVCTGSGLSRMWDPASQIQTTGRTLQPNMQPYHLRKGNRGSFCLFKAGGHPISNSLTRASGRKRAMWVGQERGAARDEGEQALRTHLVYQVRLQALQADTAVHTHFDKIFHTLWRTGLGRGGALPGPGLTRPSGPI